MSEFVKRVNASHDKSGFVLIVSNDYTSGQTALRPLEGTHKDGKLMKDTFEGLNFLTSWKKNANKGEVSKMIYDVTSTRHCKPSPEVLDSYKCIVFVFSGHGHEGGHILMQDGQQVHIGDEIIQLFLPKNCNHLAAIPKLFFIDACRGEEAMDSVLVPRGPASSKGASETLASLIPEEGNYLVAYSTLDRYKAYELSKTGGNWMQLVAKHISKNEEDSIEGVLTDVRSELVNSYNKHSALTIQQPETISRLNKQVFLKGGRGKPRKKRSMAAVFPSVKPNGSALNTNPTTASHAQPQTTYSSVVSSTSDGVQDSACFQPMDTQTPPTSMATFPYHAPMQSVAGPGPTHYTTEQQVATAPQLVTTMETAPPVVHNVQRPEPFYQQMILEYSRQNCPKLAEYKDEPLMNNQYNHVYYRSTVDLKVISPNGTSVPITGNSREYFMTYEIAREIAAQDAWTRIQRFEQHKQQQLQYSAALQPQNLSGPPPQYITAPTAPPSATGYGVQPTYHQGTPDNSHIMRSASNDASPPKGSARAKFNEFLQSRGTKPQYSFISECSNGQQRYQCTIKYTLPQQPTKRFSSSGYYASKADAKEQAAMKVIKEEGIDHRSSSSQKPQLDVSRSSPKVVNEKLFKSKLKEYFDKKGQPLVVLDYTTRPCQHGFVAEVTGPEFGRAEGEVRKSKKEAEQSAAQNALEKLLH